ncbi:MAG: sulfite oxidase [Vicinamibacteria bacterium]
MRCKRPARSSEDHALPSRREALRTMGLFGAALAAAPESALPLSWFQEGDQVIPFTDVPTDFSTRRGELVFRLDLRELRSWLTPTEEFFSVAHYDRPQVDASTWSLSVSGFVENPMSLTLDEIEKLPRVEKTLTFECSGNQASRIHGMVGNATFAGTPLKDLLDRAMPSGDVIEVAFWAADKGKEKIRDNEYEQNFARAMSIEDAMNEGAILAYEMNGEPLSFLHGYPLRLIVPGWYGIANVKWLERIELNDRRLMNRFMGRDYVTIIGREVDGKMQWFERSVTRQRVKSAIARVTKTASGRTKVFGVAWTDGAGLDSVEVRIDAGSWQKAELDDRGNPYAWTFFTLTTDPLAAGDHALVSRAKDRKGRTQPENLDTKKTYWEDNAQFKRTIAVT